jgi:two-component system, OmpR family, phosphate regulon sensor histidine kinase PhoR
MVYGNYVSLDAKEEGKNKLDYWPKYEEGLYYFGVHFPGIRSYILSEMGLWYFFTAILVIVIFFFGYSMMIILRQKRLSEVQRDFINNMSHEIRTPLTSIGLASDVLGEEGPGGDRQRFLKYSSILKEQTLILQKKVDKILQQAETEHKFFKLNKERLILKDLIEETADEFRPAVEHKKGRVVIDNPAGNPVILADRYHLSGILINLIDNALKYTDKPPLVTISILEKKGKLFLMMQDTGTGIEKKYIRKVFLPFFRVPSGNIHNVKGSGLGLSYVKKICDLHGWRIRIESEPGNGTTITMIIPKAD